MPVSNVHEHRDIIKDVLALNAALKGEQPDYGLAKNIYIYGAGNSCKSTTSVRTLQGFAKKDMTGEEFADRFIKSGFTYDFWDAPILAALDGTGDFANADNTKRVTSAKKAVLGLVTWYASHELEAAIDKLEANNTDDAKGAPHAWDEGWAFYYGSEESGEGSPYEVAIKRDKDFPTGTQVTAKIVDYFNKGLIAVRTNGANVAEARAATDTIYKLWALTYLRAGLKYLEVSEKTYSSKAHAEGYAYYMAIDGYVASFDAAAAKTMREALAIQKTEIPAGSFCTAKEQIYSALGAMGLDCAQLGEFKDSSITCAVTCDSTAGAWPAGSAAVDAIDGSADDVSCVDAATANYAGSKPTSSGSQSDAGFELCRPALSLLVLCALCVLQVM